MQFGPKKSKPMPTGVKVHPIWSRYGATDDGWVHGIRGWMSPALHRTGYTVVTVSTGESRHLQYRTHRFVWECFNGLIPRDKVIDHIDGDKTNNMLSNLRLVTVPENNQYARTMLGNWALRGEQLPGAILTSGQVREIIMQIKEGLTNDQIAANFSIQFKHVSLIRNRKRWKHIWAEVDAEETS